MLTQDQTDSRALIVQGSMATGKPGTITVKAEANCLLETGHTTVSHA